jgi:hypothetical protein
MRNRRLVRAGEKLDGVVQETLAQLAMIDVL